MLRWQALALTVALVGVCSACGKRAVVTTNSGAKFIGHIEGNDRKRVFIRTRPGRAAVHKKDIQDIDHPGNTAITMGAATAAAGALLFIMGGSAEPTECGGCAYSGAATVGVGAAISSWGAIVWGESKGAAESKGAPWLSRHDEL